MAEIENIKAKIALFPSQEIMFTLGEVEPLITTIEQKHQLNAGLCKTVLKQETTIESQKEEIARLGEREYNHYPIVIMELEGRIFKLQDEIESLKAITELILEWTKNDISIWSKVGQHVGTPKFTSLHVAQDIKAMIERLSHA